MIKRVISIALALMLMVACFAGITVSADENYEFTATLGYADAAWFGKWDASTTVTGDGDYTISWDLAEGEAATGGNVFVIDLAGANAALAAEGKELKLTALSVLIDGNELPVDLSKVLTGDIEENGNWRIEIYNACNGNDNSTKNDPPVDPNALNITSNLTVNFSVKIVTAGSYEYTATLGYADTAWFGKWDASTTVTGDGDYTISWDLAEGEAATGGNVFVIDLAGANADMAANGKALELTALSVLIDGNELPVDLSKVLTGDIEENGNWRIEIYNACNGNDNSTKNDPPVDPNALNITSNLTVNFSIKAVDASAGGEETPEEPEAPAPEFDPTASYNAYLMLQTPNWTYRDAWNSANGIGSDYWGNYVYGNETNLTYGVVTDAVVAGNGTYSITITDFGTIFEDDFATASQDYFNIIGVSTDIPLSDGVEITNVKLIIDGSTRHTYDVAYQNPDTTDYVQILIQNIWNDDVKEISYYPAPTTSLEIQFTISGFDYDKAAEEVPEDTTPATTAPAGSEPAGNDGGNTTGIIIGVVVVIAVVAVVIVVLKKKKG